MKTQVLMRDDLISLAQCFNLAHAEYLNPTISTTKENIVGRAVELLGQLKRAQLTATTIYGKEIPK